MPVLDCTVTTCHYNVDERCSLDKIKVEGKNADKMDETACGSFKVRKENRLNMSDSFLCHLYPENRKNHYRAGRKACQTARPGEKGTPGAAVPSVLMEAAPAGRGFSLFTPGEI